MRPTAPHASLLTLALVALAVSAAGCGSARPTEAQADSSTLKSSLEEALAADGRFARVSVSVNARRPDVVTLAGGVADADAIAEGGRIASRVKGVAVIYNTLRIAGGAPTVATARREEPKGKPREVVSEGSGGERETRLAAGQPGSR